MRWIPQHGKIDDYEQILFESFDKSLILERLYFIQGC